MTTPKDFEVARKIAEALADAGKIENVTIDGFDLIKPVRNKFIEYTTAYIFEALRTATEERGHRVVRQMEIIDKLTQETFGYKKRIKELEEALSGAFHREYCEAKGFGICKECIQAITKMEALNKGARDEKTT